MINYENNPDFLNSFLNYSQTYKRKSPESINQYNCDLTMFLRYMKYHFNLTDEEDFSNIQIKDFTLEQLSKIQEKDIQDFISYLSIKRNCGPATCAKRISTIRIFFKYLCITSKVLKDNPAQYLETPKLNKRLPKYLTLNDSEELLNTAQNDKNNKNKERDFAILTIFLNCGIRLSELVNINITDIKFDESKMTVIGKGNKERTIYLNDSCVDAIKAYLAVRPIEGVKKDKKNSDKALFLSNYKQRISKRTVENLVKNELAKSGLDTNKYSTHKLRHTAATLMYKSGADIRSLQELLGHESISTTEIYTHVDNEQVREAVKKNPLSNFTKKN